MDATSLVQQLQAERPALVAAVQQAAASATDPAHRAALNTILRELLPLQQALHDKRTMARQLLRRRAYHAAGGKRVIGYCVWHCTDVLLWQLRLIGEVDNAADTWRQEWLEELMHNAVSRQLPEGYTRIDP